MGILAIIGLIILAGIILAFIGAAFIGSALPLAGLFSAILSIIINWWMVWLPILIIGIIAYIARGGTNSGSSSEGVAAAIGATGGAAASEIMDRMEENNNSDDTTITDGNGFDTDPPHSSPINPSPATSPQSDESGKERSRDPRRDRPRQDNLDSSENRTGDKNSRRHVGNFGSPRHQNNNSNSTVSSSPPNRSNLNEEEEIGNMSTEVSTFYKDISQLINHLEKEEALEEDALQKQKKGEAELADALQKLQDNKTVLEILVAFKNIDVESMSQREAQKAVQKQVTGNPSHSLQFEHLDQSLETVQNIFAEIEDGLRLVQEADKELQAAEADAESEIKDVSEISQLVNNLESGLKAYEYWH